MEHPATELLRREHREMELLLQRFEVELGNPQGEGLLALAETFSGIQNHLAKHFRKEEEVFYPALAPELGATGLEITNLNDDHTSVREVSSAFQGLLDRAPPGRELAISARAELSSLGWELWNLIHHHIAEEEDGLLAFADRVLDCSRQSALAEQMNARR
jgi:hemerythrin-like domain-containing protein